MIQAHWTENGIEVVDTEPRPLKDDWVRLKVAVCGICGSDLHAYRGHETATLGMVPGHEMVGTVEDGGKGLSDSLYAVEPILFCGQCDFCANGQRQLCREHGLLGYVSPGGFAEYVNLPRYTLHPVDPSISPLTASIVEPLACGYRGVQLGRLELDSRVLVQGAGTIGLVTALLARDRAHEVAITTRYPHQVEAAKKLRLLPLGENDWEDWAADREPDVVIETVGGAADTINEAIKACRRGGRVVVVGIFTEPSSIDSLALVVKEVDIIGSSMYGRGVRGSEFGGTVELLTRYGGEFDGMLTHQFPLDSIKDAFACANDKSSQSIKVTVVSAD